MLEPAHFHTESIECTDEQLEHARSQDFPTKLDFDTESHVSEQTLVIPSMWLQEAGNHKGSFLTESKNKQMVKMDIDIKMRYPGLLSAIIAADFSVVSPYLGVQDMETIEYLSIEKNYMLDDVEINEDHLAS